MHIQYEDKEDESRPFAFVDNDNHAISRLTKEIRNKQ